MTVEQLVALLQSYRDVLADPTNASLQSQYRSNLRTAIPNITEAGLDDVVEATVPEELPPPP